MRADDAKTFGLQEVAHQLDDRLVVINDQYGSLVLHAHLLSRFSFDSTMRRVCRHYPSMSRVTNIAQRKDAK